MYSTGRLKWKQTRNISAFLVGDVVAEQNGLDAFNCLLFFAIQETANIDGEVVVKISLATLNLGVALLWTVRTHYMGELAPFEKVNKYFRRTVSSSEWNGIDISQQWHF
jgi:hypothetical protein